MLEDKPGYLLTNAEINSLFDMIFANINQINDTVELLQHTEINNLILDKKLNLTVADTTKFIHDNVDFISKELNRLRQSYRIRLIKSE